MTALDELKVIDERRRAELRAAEEAEAQRRAQAAAADRERVEAEEEQRRQQRSRAEAQAWAEAMREVEAVRAQHAADDRARVEAIEAEALARARERLAEERAELERTLLAPAPRPRRRGWLALAAVQLVVIAALALWGHRQRADLGAEVAARGQADRAAAAATERAERLLGEVRSTTEKLHELRGKVELLARERAMAPAVTPAAVSAKPGRPATRPGRPGGSTSTTGGRELTVCTDSPLC